MHLVPSARYPLVNISLLMRYDVLRAMKIIVFGDVTPCSLVCIGGTCCLHVHGRGVKLRSRSLEETGSQ
jgi:hypothetical protein